MNVIQNQIYCFIPFYLDNALESHPGELWVEQKPYLDSDAMYPYMGTGSRMHSVYALNFAGNASLSKFMRQTSYVRGAGGNHVSVVVNLLNVNTNSWRTPRLVVTNDGEVGVLIIPLTVSCADAGESLTDDMVCAFVNRLQKYDSTQVPVFEYRLKNNNSTIQDNIDADLRLKHRDMPHTWTIATLADFLLAPLKGRISMFKPFRAHILTELLASGSDNGPHLLSDRDKISLLRITHCQNARYHTLLDDRTTRVIMPVFGNSYAGVSAEGACCMQILQHDEADSYLEKYPAGTFQSRFMWLYVNAFVQRHALLNIDRQLADAVANVSESGPMTKEDCFNATVPKLCAIRLCGAFSNVSAYSHINALNSFLSKNLGVTDLYAELDEKLHSIDTWIKLIEAQRQNEAARIMKSETEKRQKFENFLQTGGVILAILALLYGIPQSITALNDAWRGSLWGWTLICLVPAIIGMTCLIILMKRSRR